MAPAELAGLVVDGLEDSLSPDAVIRARPSVDAIGWLGKVNAPARMSVDNKQPVSCVETWGPKIRQAALVGRNQASVRRWFLVRIGNGTALLIDSKRPVHGTEWSGQKILAVGAVKHKEVAIARGLHEHLLWRAVKRSVDQHRSLDGIPVMRIVGRHLEGPHKLAGIRIEGDDTT